MKMMLSILFSLAAVAVEAHESLAPHHHPHGVSMLPNLGGIAVGTVVLAAALVVYLGYWRS